MSRAEAALAWLENKSDWLSPIVVKEVRQVVRGREFNYSFGASLVAGVAVAFFGAADALTGNGTSGSWTFIALIGCLAFLGLGVVPLAAFSALRNERMEQTLELITLTALSPRRIVLGKLLAQAVKLATLFAGVAPFITMSFLLGGIDFVTILVALLALFMASLWACAGCLFLSTLLKTRAMSGFVFGGVGFVLFLVFVLGRSLFYFTPYAGRPTPGGGADFWWPLAIATTLCLASMANLILLAENRLSLPTENRVTPLRVGFLVQFLLIVGWHLSFLGEPAAARSNVVEVLGVFGGLHVALVAMFAVTEPLVVPRRVLLHMNRPSRWRGLRTMFLPGGGRGAVYVLAQMALLIIAAWLLGATRREFGWLLAICGYICFFTGVPAVAFRFLEPDHSGSLYLRVTVLVLLPASMLLPDIIHYVLWRPDVLSLNYSARHLINPIRTLANWQFVERQSWFLPPIVMGLTGLVAYFGLIRMGARMTAREAAIERRTPAAVPGEQSSADAIY